MSAKKTLDPSAKSVPDAKKSKSDSSPPPASSPGSVISPGTLPPSVAVMNTASQINSSGVFSTTITSVPLPCFATAVSPLSSPPKDPVKERYDRIVNNGNQIIDDAVKIIPGLATIKRDLQQSMVAYAKADSLANDPKLGTKTVMSDGNHAISGQKHPTEVKPFWGDKDKPASDVANSAAAKSSNLVFKDPGTVRAYCRSIHHVPKELSRDKDFYVCHADKQLLIYYNQDKNTPPPPLGDSRQMCEDCFTFMVRHARAKRETVIVTDPEMIHIIEPNGNHTQICHADFNKLSDMQISTPPPEISGFDRDKGCVYLTERDIGGQVTKRTKYFPDGVRLEHVSFGDETEYHPDGTRKVHKRGSGPDDFTIYHPDGSRSEQQRLYYIPDRPDTIRTTRTSYDSTGKKASEVILEEHRPDSKDHNAIEVTHTEATFHPNSVMATQKVVKKDRDGKVVFESEKKYNTDSTLAFECNVTHQADGSKNEAITQSGITTMSTYDKDGKLTYSDTFDPSLY